LTANSVKSKEEVLWPKSTATSRTPSVDHILESDVPAACKILVHWQIQWNWAVESPDIPFEQLRRKRTGSESCSAHKRPANWNGYQSATGARWKKPTSPPSASMSTISSPSTGGLRASRRQSSHRFQALLKRASRKVPVRQTFHTPHRGLHTTEFSAVEVNSKLSAGAFDLPGNAKRAHVD
jgi:hypothetical protein